MRIMKKTGVFFITAVLCCGIISAAPAKKSAVYSQQIAKHYRSVIFSTSVALKHIQIATQIRT